MLELLSHSRKLKYRLTEYRILNLSLETLQIEILKVLLPSPQKQVKHKSSLEIFVLSMNTCKNFYEQANIGAIIICALPGL